MCKQFTKAPIEFGYSFSKSEQTKTLSGVSFGNRFMTNIYGNNAQSAFHDPYNISYFYVTRKADNTTNLM